MKKTVLSLTLGCIALGVNANPITPSEALQRLGGASHRLASATKGSKGPKLVHTANTKSGSPAVYIFNRGDNNGYMVLSADDKAYPLLGYSDSGSFTAGDLNPQLEWWLSEYAAQIEYANAHPSSNSLASQLQQATRANREAIAPQIKTRWDQGAPYNNMAPKYGTERTYTGCVATAMAQVMNYFQYPEIGKGSISYDSESLGKRLSLNFGLRKFDWANMADTYLPGQYTEAEADAVAYLMKAAGYSVRMDYAQDSSGALAMYIRNGLFKYFDYDQNMHYDLRMYHSASEWDQMMYDNLKNVGPVIYGGGSMIGGGHSFICDGYDPETGFFHFNWGWSSMSDGYFSLDALNPNDLGAGGGNGGGYNFTQDGVFGVQPPTGLPLVERPTEIGQMGTLAAKVTDGVMQFTLTGEESAMWVNYNPSTLRLQVGAIIEPQGNTKGETLYKTISDVKFNLEPGYGVDPSKLATTLNLADANLADGTYKVTAAAAFLDKNDAIERWQPMHECHGNYNYVVLKKQGEDYTVTITPPAELILEDESGIVGDLVYGCINKVHIKVTNPSDVELSKGFAPCFMAQTTDGGWGLIFLGESVFVSVKPGETVEKDWYTQLYALQQIQAPTADVQLQLGFFDESTYNFFLPNLEGNSPGNPITLKKNPGVPKLELTSTSLGGVPQTEKLNGQNILVYPVTDPSNIDVTSRFKLVEGYFAYNVMACVTQYGDETGAIYAMSGQPMFLQPSVRPTTFKTTVHYANADPTQLYQMMMAYVGPDGYYRLIGNAATFFRVKSSGVNDLEQEEETVGDGTIYSLQGIALGKDLETLPAGIYIRNGKKIIKK